MSEESSSKYKFQLDKKEILKKLNSYKKYQTNNTTIIRWEDDLNLDTEMYIMKNKINNLPFLGVVNYEFKREGYCLNSYLNGDEYFGYYSNDLRNKQGLYIYKPRYENNNKILRQYYFGLWENDLKHGRGVYLWLKEDKISGIYNNNLSNKLYNPFKNNFDKANFEAYIGKFEQNKFTKGTLIKKEGNNYFVFHGFFQGMKKNGTNCFYFSAKLEELLYGTFKDDVFIDGFVGKFNDEGELEKIIKYKDEKILDEKSDENKEKKKKMLTFRNVIMSKDYFGILYNIFKDAINFKNDHMNDIELFNSDTYLDLMDIAASYNQASIFKDIEKYLKG